MSEFDLARLSTAIDVARADRGLTWKAVSAEVGVAATTIRRFGTAADAEADGVLALIGWLGVPPEDFVNNSKVPGEELPASRAGFIRVDMAKVRHLAAETSRSKTTRTTIQRLVKAAQAAHVSVASLTRWSQI